MNGYSLGLIGAGLVIAALNAGSYREAGGYVLAGACVVAGVVLEVVTRVMRKQGPPPDDLR